MWVNREEQEFFLGALKPEYRVLEWGSGQSSPEIAKRVKSLITMEHNPEWFSKAVNSNIPNNMLPVFRRNNLPWKSVDGTLEEFEDYIKTPLSFGPFDFIYIDGRARVECARICPDLVASQDTPIFIHDFGPEMKQGDGTYRKHYDVVLEWLEPVGHVKTMYEFRLK